MARSLQQQLDDLDALIAEIESTMTVANGAIVYQVRGQSVTRAALQPFYDERRRLMAETSAASAGMSSLATFTRPR